MYMTLELASPWEKIYESDPALSEFRVGDFVGDQRADVFYTDGLRWYISDAGRAPFRYVQDSGFRAAALGFGDFNRDGKMDVVGVESGQWSVSVSTLTGFWGAWSNWRLGAARTKTMAGLTIADLNGNGYPDIVRFTRINVALNAGGVGTIRWNVEVSWESKTDWQPLGTIDDVTPGSSLPVIGRFDSTPGPDIVAFLTGSYRNTLGIKSSGGGALTRYSRQDMR